MGKINRFYDTFHPNHYDLFINVNRADKKINGTSTVTGEALSKEVSIHQKFMSISKVTQDGKEVPFEVDEKAEAIKIKLITDGQTVISIDYSAPLTDTMMGCLLYTSPSPRDS